MEILDQQTENTLYQENEFLKHIIESLPYPFYVIKPEDYTVVMANKAANFGILSKRSTCYQLTHHRETPCDEEEHPCPVRRLVQTKQPCTIEHAHYDLNGNRRYTNIHAYPIFNQSGEVELIIEYALDITARKQAEEEVRKYRERLEELVEKRTAELQQVNIDLRQEIIERKRIEKALRKSEHQYRDLAEKVVDGIIILQEERIVFVNPAFCEVVGYPSEHLLKVNLGEVLHDASQQRCLAWLQQLLEPQSAPSVQTICLSGDQKEIWIEARSSSVEWEGRLAILVTVREITAQKRDELEREQQSTRLERENIALRSTMKERYRFGELIGKSPAMQEIYALIARAAATDANVVISGESGTGKELMARMIHRLSPRKEHDFVAVNCGAIPENLFESEFFGHRKGAFTGADRDKPGYFDRAHRGTLFLDEIGELSPLLQVKLLRAIEQQEYIPVGSNTSKNVDVHIVAATNRNLEEQVRQKQMREDFFFRLSVITITVPPLRDRREDLPLLIDYFLTKLSKETPPPILPGYVAQMLYHHDWPGNIRELQNVLQRYLSLNRLEFPGSRALTPASLHEHCTNLEIAVATQDLQRAVECFEKQFLLRALEQHHWHKVHTAQALGIGRKTLYRKLQQYGLLDG